MADGILQRFPDVNALLQKRDTAEAGINALLGAFGALGAENAASPIASVAAALNGLGDKLNIDLSGLSNRLPAAIDVIQNALPAGAIEYVQSIEQAYSAARNFLQESALAREVREGGSLQETALAVIDDALQLFDARIKNLTDGLVDPATLEQVKSAFAAIENFRADFPAHQNEFLPFITRNLVGVAPDLLRPALNHLDNAFAVLAPLDAVALNPAREALANAFRGLFTAIESLDPAATGGYVQIRNRLNEIEIAIEAMLDGLAPFYAQVQALVESHAWEAIFSTYRTLLEAINFQNVPSVDDVVDSLAAVLEEILARFHMVFGVDDLTQRISELNQTIRDTFVNSALGQIRQTLTGFLEQIRDAIQSVPTGEIQATVENMLRQIKQQLDALGITQISDDIKNAFAELEAFVTNAINDTLKNNVQTAVSQLLSQVRNLPIADLVSFLTDALAQLASLIQELESKLAGYISDLNNFLSQLDGLSFRPVSDAVIEEIDELKSRLQAIDPNALSDLEKIAIKGAIAVLEAIDLETQAINGLKAGFAEAQNGVKSLLGQITEALGQVREKAGVFNPQQLLTPVCGTLEQATALIERANGKLLFRPLYEQVDDLVKRLEAISPGRVLDPLQAPYNTMLGAVNQLNPDNWVAPLNALYDKINQLISYVDVTPVFDELDRRQKELFLNLRTAILKTLDDLDLPEPAKTFFNSLRPVIEGMTEAIFGDPETALKKISVDLRAQIRLSSLFMPLDTVFNQLAGMIESIPPGDLTATMNTIREGIGVGLEVLEPRAIVSRFRSGQGGLAELSPAVLLAMPLALPGLKLAFQAKAADAPPERSGDVAAISARFDAVFTPVDPGRAESRLHRLVQSHEALLNALRLKINALEVSGAGAAYANLRRNLDRLVPDFLRRPQALTHAEIIAGIYALRPSAKAEKFDRVLERFLQRLKPLEGALEPAVNGFFSSIREAMMLVNPLELKEAVTGIYDAIRAKARILDPAALAGTIHENFFDPLIAPLQAIDPGRIKLQINETFAPALGALSRNVKGILDEIVKALDEQLRAIREAVRAFLTQLKDAIKGALQSAQNVLAQIERLVFVEILERLNRVIDNLGVSFGKEMDRVRNAFDAMLEAIPV